MEAKDFNETTAPQNEESMKQEASMSSNVDEKDVENVNTDVEKQSEPISEEKEQISVELKEKPTAPSEPEKVDYSQFSKEEMVAMLRKLISEKPIQQLKDEVDSIKSNFYKRHKAEVEELKAKFIEEGGLPEEFEPKKDAFENQLKELLQKYKEQRATYYEKIETEKQNNLKVKKQVIEDIKELINKEESLNQTFKDFRNLQNQWKEIGLVPQSDVKGLWESYHYSVEKFYDFVNINKELRDLDLKKNLQAKIELCEKAEALILEPLVIKAFKDLQVFHDQWREIGPVDLEKRDEIWERFKEASTKINKKHQDYFDQLKVDQENNLKLKTVLCEKAEVVAGVNCTTYKEWDEKSTAIIEFQGLWKMIGMVPKKDNAAIYQRFKEACNQFFDKKKEYFKELKQEQNDNLQQKIDICVQVEVLQESTDWKKTTMDIIAFQKQWKSGGSVPRKQSDIVWKRFRKACDTFFNNKEKHFASLGSAQEGNLKLKEELITKIETFVASDDSKADLASLQTFQKDWSDIGHVPFKQKDDVQKKFRQAVNKHFDSLKINEKERSMIQFKNRIGDFKQSSNSDFQLTKEKNHLLKKISQMENDIFLWENNIGFFANSSNAEALVKDVERKIEKAKQIVIELKEKLSLIDKI